MEDMFVFRNPCAHAKTVFGHLKWEPVTSGNSVTLCCTTRRLAAYTQAVVQLRSTRYTAIELNVLHYFI